MQRIYPISGLLGLLSLWAMPAHAAITYDLALRAPGKPASIDHAMTVEPGARITDVELVLIETVSGETASILGNDADFPGTTNRNGNLAAYQGNLLMFGSDGTFANLTPNLTGGGANPNNDSDTIAFAALGNIGIVNQPGIRPTVTGVNTQEAILGSVDLIAPTSGSTRFRLADFSSSDGDFTTFSTGSLEQAARLSGGSFNSRSLTVTAVPEPASFAAILVIAVAVVVLRLRIVRHRARQGIA